MSECQLRAALLIALGQQLRNLFRLWEAAQLVDELLRAMLSDYTAKVRNMLEPCGPVQHTHSVLNMWGQVERAEKLDRIIICLEDLGNLESEHATVRIAGDSIRPVRLLLLQCVVVGRYDFGQAIERLLAWVEATGAQSVDWPVRKVLDQTQEDEDLADAGVNKP